MQKNSRTFLHLVYITVCCSMLAMLFGSCTSSSMTQSLIGGSRYGAQYQTVKGGGGNGNQAAN